MANAVISRLKLPSTRAPEFIDITQRVAEQVRESGVRDGLACIYSKHTTAAIKINENEPLLITDMEVFLKKLAPVDQYYAHNDFSIRTVNMAEDECPNGHAHCSHLMLPSSETIPIIDGELQLGRFQSIFVIALDHPRDREVLITVMGT